MYLGRPITVNAPLTFTRNNSYVATVCMNNGSNAFSGSSPLTIGGGVRFEYAIAYTSAKNTYSGPIIVNSARAILYASSGADFAEAARSVAERARDLLNAASDQVPGTRF